jgi:hypothetical protein
MSSQAVQQALGLPTSPRHMMNRMVQAGLLRRVQQGVYGMTG